MTEFALRFGPHRLAGYRTGSGTPLLLVHGGPGVPCGYVYEAHAHYAGEGFEVVSWDQLGCGRSDRPDDPSLWNVARFVDEVEEVRRQLGWDRFILMGNSWAAYWASSIACGTWTACAPWSSATARPVCLG